MKWSKHNPTSMVTPPRFDLERTAAR